MPEGYKIKPTIKQKNAVLNMVENGGNISKAMRDAKYTKKTAKNPKKLTDSKGYKIITIPILKQLEEEREEALKEARKKRGKAAYHQCIDAIDKITKNIQLLSGEATERVEETIVSPEELKAYNEFRKSQRK